MLFANFENKKTALLSRFVKNKLGAYFFSSASSSSMALVRIECYYNFIFHNF